MHTYRHTHTHTQDTGPCSQQGAIFNSSQRGVTDPPPSRASPRKTILRCTPMQMHLYHLGFLNSGIRDLADQRETAPLAGPGSSQRQRLDSVSLHGLTKPGPTGPPPTAWLPALVSPRSASALQSPPKPSHEPAQSLPSLPSLPEEATVQAAATFSWLLLLPDPPWAPPGGPEWPGLTLLSRPVRNKLRFL